DCHQKFENLVELSKRGGGCSTVIVQPGDDIQKAIDSLPEEGGCICLKAGTHKISSPIRIETSDVFIHGETPSTRIVYEHGWNVFFIGSLKSPGISNITIDDVQFELIDLHLNEDEFPLSSIAVLICCENISLKNCKFILRNTRSEIPTAGLF
ncbi:MAG: hypothetical protein ACFFCW_39550, partial [Candidatus Hodarchaeota archaeon]